MPGMSPRIKRKKQRFPLIIGTELAPITATPIVIGVALSNATTSAGYRSIETTEDSYGTISDDQYGEYTIFYFHTKSNVTNVVRFQLHDISGNSVLPYNKVEVSIDSQPAVVFFPTEVSTNGGAPYSGYYRSQDVDLQTYINSKVGSTISITLGPRA